LIAAREKVEQLEGELEEAWKEAAPYTNEMEQVEAASVDWGLSFPSVIPPVTYSRFK